MSERYKTFVSEQNHFESICRSVVKSLPSWGSASPTLNKVDFGQTEVTIQYYYPRGDYDNIDVTIPLEDFLNKSPAEMALDIEEKQRKEKEAESQRIQAEYERGQRAELKRLQERYPEA